MPLDIPNDFLCVEYCVLGRISFSLNVSVLRAFLCKKNFNAATLLNCTALHLADLQTGSIFSRLRPRQQKEFENGGFTQEEHQMFSVLTALEQFKNATITSHFRFAFEEILV